MQIVSNTARNQGPGSYDGSVHTTALTADHYAQAVIGNTGTNVYIDIKLRRSGTGGTSNGYQVAIGRSAGDWYITRYDNGSGTDIASGSTTAPGVGAVLRGEVEGNTIRILLNGVLLGSTTDNTYATGAFVGIGIFAGDGNGFVDDFEAGDLEEPVDAGRGRLIHGKLVGGILVGVH